MALPDYTERSITSCGPEGLVQIPSLVCLDCGRPRRTGDWPMCPHSSDVTFGEDPIEPYIDEHIDENPVLITSRGQRRALMEKNHLVYRKKRTDLIPSSKRYFFT